MRRTGPPRQRHTAAPAGRVNKTGAGRSESPAKERDHRALLFSAGWDGRAAHQIHQAPEGWRNEEAVDTQANKAFNEVEVESATLLPGEAGVALEVTMRGMMRTAAPTLLAVTALAAIAGLRLTAQSSGNPYHLRPNWDSVQ